MRCRVYVLLSLVTFVAAARGQEPNAKATPLKDLDYLRNLAQTRAFMLGRPVRPQPTPDGKAVLFLRSGPRTPRLSLFEFDVATGKTRELLTPEQVLKGVDEKLSPEEKARRERMRVSVGGFTRYQLSDDGQLILLTLSGKLYLVRRDDASVRALKTGAGTLLDPQLSPDAKKVAYVRDHDLYVLDLDTEQERRLTEGGTTATPNGVAEFVAQEEMARFHGFWWSPDSVALAYQHTDQRDVETWYVADPMAPGQPPTPFFYPRPGKANARVKLGVVPIAGGATTWLAWDAAKFPYLASVHWSADGPLMLVVQTRDQKDIALLSADLKTGTTTTLLTEHQPAWINLRQDVPRWLPGDHGLLWVAERDGGPRLELRTASGRFKRVLVTPDLGFQGLLSVDAKGREIAFTASTNPTQSQVYRLSLTEVFSDPEPLTKEPGVHTAVFSRDHALVALTTRRLDDMPRTHIQTRDGKEIGELPSVAEEPPFRRSVEILRVAKDPDYYAAIVFPRDFNPRQKYPVIVDVYGGPHHIHVTASLQRWLLDQWYANQGFLVVAIDGRGTPGRGTVWERAIHEKFGSIPLDDQVRGLEALATDFPALDVKRVGIDGWSFGGYMAAQAVLRRPDIFRAAVAGAPVTDWYDYDTHYTERYLGIPPDAAKVYDDASLLPRAGDLRRPLLLLHGTADDNVYFRHTLKLVDALFRQGKEVEVLPLSGLTHMVPDPDVMERLHSRIALFFRRHLAETPAAPRRDEQDGRGGP